MEFGRQNGFKKLLELIANNNNDLGRIFSKALLHFLNIPQLQTKLLSTFGIVEQLPDEQLNSIKSKLKKLADDFKTITASELQRIFSPQGPRKVSGISSPSPDGTLGTMDELTSGRLLLSAGSSKGVGGMERGGELPDQDDIFEFMMSQSKLLDVQLQNKASGGGEVVFSPTTKMKGNVMTKDEEDIMKEFAVVQGGIRSICDSLLEAAEEIQLDFMGALTKLLLSGNPNYKAEFKNIHGYGILAKFFNDPTRNFADQNTLYFLESCFELIALMIYEDEASALVTNLDAFVFLLELMANSPHHEIISFCLNHLNAIFHANWRNTIIGQKVGFPRYIFHLLKRVIRSNNKKLFYLDTPSLDVTPILCMKPTEFNESSLLLSFEEESKSVGPTLHQNKGHQVSGGLDHVGQHQPGQSAGVVERMEIDDDKTDILLFQISRLMMSYSNVLGVYDSDVEMIFCELALTFEDMEIINEHRYMSPGRIRQFFLDSLFEVLLMKLPRLCGSFIFAEDFHDMLFSKLTLAFRSIYCHYENFGDADNFLKAMHVIDRVLTCRHTHNSNQVLNTFMSDTRPSNKQSLTCRNICKELQRHIIESIKAEVRTPSGLYTYLDLLHSKGGRKLEFMSMLKLLKDTLLQADDLMNLFMEEEGIQRLFSILFDVYKDKLRADSFFLNDVGDILLELAVGSICEPARLRGHGLTMLKPSQIDEIPCFDVKRTSFLILLFKLLLASPSLTEDNAAIFELLNLMLQKTENLKILKDKQGFHFLLRLVAEFNTTDRHYLHLQLMTCFELFIPRMTPEELESYFDIIINIQFLKKETAPEIFVDTLSLITLHLALNTNPALLEKICVNDYLFVKLLPSQNLFACIEFGDYYVIEAVLKQTVLLLSLAKNVKAATKIPALLVNNKPKVILLLCRMLSQMADINERVLNLLFDLCFFAVDSKTNNHIANLFPSHSTTVSTIINRSAFAAIILTTTTPTTTSTAPTRGQPTTNVPASHLPSTHINPHNKVLHNIEFLEIFLVCLRIIGDDNLKNEYIKKLEGYLDPLNIDRILETPNFLPWIATFIREDIARADTPKYMPTLFHFIFKLFHHDLKKPPKHSKFLEIMKRSAEDDYIVGEIIRMVLVKLRDNPVITEADGYLLKNLVALYQNVYELTGVCWDVDFLMLLLINTFASKNAGTVRTQMKNLELFDIRDNLLVQILHFSVDSKVSTAMMTSIKELSFGAVANQSKFRDSHTLAFLVKLLIDKNTTTIDVQHYIVRVLKEEVSASEENQKYIAKLIDNQKIVLSLFPNYNQTTMSSLAKCLSSIRKNSSILNESERKDNDDEDHSQGEDDSGDEEDNGEQRDVEMKKELELLQSTTQEKATTKTMNTGPGTPKSYMTKSTLQTKELIDYINSSYFDDERAAVLARIRKNIASVLADYSKTEGKIQNKIAERKKKVFESNVRERQNQDKQWAEIESRLDQINLRASDKFKSFVASTVSTQAPTLDRS